MLLHAWYVSSSPRTPVLSLHFTFLNGYRVAAGSARPLRDYHLMHDSSIIHDYRLPRDPSYSTILPGAGIASCC